MHIDTGMNRLGLPGEELVDPGGGMEDAACRHLNLVLVMSHLACGDEPNSKMNDEQLVALPHRAGHAAAGARQPGRQSGGAYLGKPYLFDLVRPGVALYGGAARRNGARQSDARPRRS